MSSSYGGSAVPTRLGRRRLDLQKVQRSAALIETLNASLDREMAAATRPEERLRLLREATNQITRAANDAIQAYRRVAEAVRVELERQGGEGDAALEMRQALAGARADLLRVLGVASQRYPWAKPWMPSDEVAVPGEAEGAPGDEAERDEALD